MKSRLGAHLFSLCRLLAPQPRPGPLPRGRAQSVIVVTVPGAAFTEALFFVREEPGVSREALLREARAAAESFSAAYVPPRRESFLPPAAWLLLGAALALLAAWLCGGL